MMKISVVTPCYNSARTIRETIESVLAQDYAEVEYLIIDGGSTDETVEIARAYEARFAERGWTYRISSEPDHGIYDAMNKGVRMATGEIVGIINSDDWYEPEALSYVAGVYAETRFDLFYADLNMWECVDERSGSTAVAQSHGDIVERCDGTWRLKLIKHSRLRRLMVSRDWNHPTTFITKETYNDYPYKLESIHDDWDLILRLHRAGKKVVVRNQVLANFRMNGASHERNIVKSMERIRARYRIYRNNGYSRWYLAECIAIEAAKFIAG